MGLDYTSRHANPRAVKPNLTIAHIPGLIACHDTYPITARLFPPAVQVFPPLRLAPIPPQLYNPVQHQRDPADELCRVEMNIYGKRMGFLLNWDNVYRKGGAGEEDCRNVMVTPPIAALWRTQSQEWTENHYVGGPLIMRDVIPF
jgi:hypothetical protein